MLKYYVCWLLLMSAVTFFLMGWDKHLARSRRRRSSCAADVSGAGSRNVVIVKIPSGINICQRGQAYDCFLKKRGKFVRNTGAYRNAKMAFMQR